jgi:hypothetical protein
MFTRLASTTNIPNILTAPLHVCSSAANSVFPPCRARLTTPPTPTHTLKPSSGRPGARLLPLPSLLPLRPGCTRNAPLEHIQSELHRSDPRCANGPPVSTPLPHRPTPSLLTRRQAHSQLLLPSHASPHPRFPMSCASRYYRCPLRTRVAGSVKYRWRMIIIDQAREPPCRIPTTTSTTH